MSEAVRMEVENPMAEKDAPSDEDGASLLWRCDNATVTEQGGLGDALGMRQRVRSGGENCETPQQCFSNDFTRRSTAPPSRRPPRV